MVLPSRSLGMCTKLIAVSQFGAMSIANFLFSFILKSSRESIRTSALCTDLKVIKRSTGFTITFRKYSILTMKYYH